LLSRLPFNALHLTYEQLIDKPFNDVIQRFNCKYVTESVKVGNNMCAESITSVKHIN